MDEGGLILIFIYISVRNIERMFVFLEMDVEVLKCREERRIKGVNGLLK